MRTPRRLCLVLAAALLVAGCGAPDDAETPEGDRSVEQDDEVARPDAEDDLDAPGGADGGPEAGEPDTGLSPNGADGDEGGSGGADQGDFAGVDPPSVPPLHPVTDGFDETVVLIDGNDGEVRVDAKIVSQQADRQRGLMEVEVLPDGVGMLFVFEESRTGGFWMKNTLVPLDIAFSDDEGEILAILTMVPCEDDPCPSYNPGVEYLTALEVPAGWFAQQSVEAGNRLRWSDPVPAA